MYGATITLVGEPTRVAAVTYQRMPVPDEFVMKLTNLRLTPEMANESLVCVKLGGPCPTLQVRKREIFEGGGM